LLASNRNCITYFEIIAATAAKISLDSAPVSVSYFFGHYPSSQFLNKIQRFRDWLCLHPQVIKEKGKGKREVILSVGSLRQS
jgi:hypothetical protein